MNNTAESPAVLWLPNWYPNKTEPYTGDFLQRHAKAVALYRKVHVFHVVRDKHALVTRHTHYEKQQEGLLSETILYYHSPLLRWKLADRVLSGIYCLLLFHGYLVKYMRENGKPPLIHLHVVGKNVWAGLWLKLFHRIPLFLSEHWTLFLPEASPGFHSLSFLQRWLWKKAMTVADGISVVSHYLGTCIKGLGGKEAFTVIPNVVDTHIFYPGGQRTQDNCIRFIHISTLGYQKNPEAIVQACAILKNTRRDFHLEIIGPPATALQALVQKANLENEISFGQEMPQTALAERIRLSNALILYSRYETFGCVLIEANACGKPVIVSDIPVFHENVQDGFNGRFAAADNPASLAATMQLFMEQTVSADESTLSKFAADNYSFKKVGAMFIEFYQAKKRT